MNIIHVREHLVGGHVTLGEQDQLLGKHFHHPPGHRDFIELLI